MDGVSVFKYDVYTNELFEKWIDEKYFNVILEVPRHPRYRNKRGVDVQVKMYIDENGVEMPNDWGLPLPNAEAAYKSLAKYAKPILPMSELEVLRMNQAWAWTEKHFGLYMANARVLNLEEAVTHLDLSTSSGFPFNILFPKKRELFENDPSILDWLEKDWNLLGTDPHWTCLATNSLKEELRTRKKIEDNSIRTFTSMPMDATTHGTRLFVDMNEKMYDSHLKTASVVGMSPFDGNWDALYHHLNAFNNGYALDEKEYDSSLRVYLMWGCAQFRWKMLAPEFQTVENKLRIKTYYRNLINTLIITPEGVVVQKKTGNPSGSCNTITDNTLILYTLLAYAWLATVPDEMQNLTDFEMLTSKALVGDDNTWTVSDLAHPYYNAYSVIAVWKTLGITTTTDSMEPRKAQDLDFLSAKFFPIAGVMVPLYEREKILNSIFYAPIAKHSPSVTLERTAALLANGWADLQLRLFCRKLMAWLLQEYDDVLREDPEWIRAKTQIQTDDIYFERFTGLRLAPQSILGKRERLIKPNKKEMSDYMPDNIASKIERSENALTATLTNCNVTMEGQAFLDYALDPYKDSQGRPPCLGRPDLGQRNIVVSNYSRTVTISRPATVPAGSTWDCHVLNCQTNNSIGIRRVTYPGENCAEFNPATPTVYQYGGVMILAGPAGTNLGLLQTVGQLAVPPAYFGGQNNSRVIYKAHQITNTTPLLNQGGNALMYERTMPDPRETMQTINVSENGNLIRKGALMVFDDEAAFRSPAELIQMPKTRQHAAKLGSYQVCTQCAVLNNPVSDKAIAYALLDGSGFAFLTNVQWVPIDAGRESPNVQPGDFPFNSPFNVNGSYFTSLSSETSLVVAAMWGIETGPSTLDVRMMSLAHPSPPVDYCALEIYEKISHRLPAGVSVKDNAAGDWIQTIAALAQETGLPGAGLLKMGGKMINAVQKFYQTDYGQMTKTGNNISGKTRRPQIQRFKKKNNNSIQRVRVVKGSPPKVVRKRPPPKRIQTVVLAKPRRRQKQDVVMQL